MSNSEITDQGYRQAVRNNVLLSRVLIAMSFALLGCVVGFIMLLPLKTTEWLVYEFSSSGNTFVKVARANDKITANHALISMLLRQYVGQREVINRVDEQDRYASVVAQSSNNVSGVFQEIYGGANSPLNKEGFKRAVVINRDSSLGVGLHQVEFTTTDTVKDADPSVREWVASISYTWKPQKVRFDKITINPAGLVVTQYTLAARAK